MEAQRKSAVLNFFALLLVVILFYSGCRAWGILRNYKDEAAMHGAVMEYRPEPEAAINQGVIDLRAKYPDVVGWLTVPGTNIDYPFVRCKDNDYYLRRDLNGDYAVAGTLFMDYRCGRDFSSQNTIVYGHHMKNGSMFGTLKAFADKAFFDENKYGTICLPCETLTLEFFAYMVVKHTDEVIYGTALTESYLDYIRQNARHYRDIGLTGGDRVLTLSTCSYEFDGARMVLLAVIT